MAQTFDISDSARDYDLLAESELADPYPSWLKARSDYPVFQSSVNGIWYLTRHQDIVEALRDPETFSSRFAGRSFVDDIPAHRRDEVDALLAKFPDPSRFLVTSDAPEHARRRGLSQLAFSPGRIRALEPAIERIADELCVEMAEHGECDLMSTFAYQLSTQVIAQIIGLDEALIPTMQQVSEDLLVLSLATGQELSDEQVDVVLQRLERIAAMHESIAVTVAERSITPADDIIGGLVVARLDDESRLEDADVIALAFELMLAGTDTTANLIAHAVLFTAADSPSSAERLWSRLADDQMLAEAVVEETLRRRGSSKGLFRVTTRDVTVAGVQIPAGSFVHPLYGSANHDEQVFSCPRDFDLDRAEIRRHIAFGFGAHFCLGAPLARLETRVALQSLSKAFPRLVAPAPETLEYLPAMTTHTLRQFMVQLDT